MSDDLHNRIRIVRASEVGVLRAGAGDWGPWRLDAELRVLYPISPYRYEIDLDTCTSSADVLDWICQIAGKDWADDATLAGLVRALNDVLYPQAHLCSSGRSKRMTQRQIIAQVARFQALIDGTNGDSPT